MRPDKQRTGKHGEKDQIVQRIDEIEWCSLGDVPRRLKFPFPVKVVGWIITGAAHYNGTHRTFGTEFCVRIRSSDSSSVDVVSGVRHECAFPHVMMKRPGEHHEFRVKAGPQAMYASVVRCNLNQNDASVPVWALSASEGNGGKRLRVRCSTATADGIDTARINEDSLVEVFDGRWHHVALMLSQSGGQTTASLYKDYEATPSWSKTVVGSLYYGAGYAPVWVGSSSSTTAFFNGQIDELRISRGILAPIEFLRRGTLPFVIVVK